MIMTCCKKCRKQAIALSNLKHFIDLQSIILLHVLVPILCVNILSRRNILFLFIFVVHWVFLTPYDLFVTLFVTYL